MIFRGRFEYTIDPKGRVNIPAAFRDRLQESAQGIVFPHQLLGLLLRLRRDDWARIEERFPVSQAPTKMNAFVRFFLGGAVEVVLRQAGGRILVRPPCVPTRAGKGCRHLGMPNRFRSGRSHGGRKRSPVRKGSARRPGLARGSAPRDLSVAPASYPRSFTRDVGRIGTRSRRDLPRRDDRGRRAREEIAGGYRPPGGLLVCACAGPLRCYRIRARAALRRSPGCGSSMRTSRTSTRLREERREGRRSTVPCWRPSALTVIYLSLLMRELQTTPDRPRGLLIVPGERGGRNRREHAGSTGRIRTEGATETCG